MNRNPPWDAHSLLMQLDKYSRSVAEDIFADYPEWLAYASVDPLDGHSLLVQVPRPVNSHEARHLTISTLQEEITVFCDFFHEHYYEWEEEERLGWNYFEDAKGLVYGIINEEIIFAVKMEGDKWLQSKTVTRDQFDHLKSEFWTYTTSWLGTYDRSFE